MILCEEHASDGAWQEEACPAYLGPFQLLRSVGTLAFELELPPSMEVHDIFHASMLRP